MLLSLPAARAWAWGMGVFLSCAVPGCGSGDSNILVTVGTAPTRATQLQVTATLDGKAAMTPQSISPPVASFGITEPASLSGQLTVTAQALDSDGCTQASSTGAITLPSGRADLSMNLIAQSPRKCGSLQPCAASTVCSQPKPAGFSQNIESIWAFSPTDVWAAAHFGNVLHYDGTSWTVVQTPASVVQDLYGIWGSSPTDIWAVGQNGLIIHYNGTQWSTVFSPVTLNLYGIYGVSGTEIWAAGGDASLTPPQGVFIKYNGTVWSSISDPVVTAQRFNGVWADKTGGTLLVYGCGNKGLLARYDGSTWNTINSPFSGTTVNLHAIWGTSDHTVFAAADAGQVMRIRYSDGGSASWTLVSTPSSFSGILYGLSGDNGSVVLAAGQNGTVLRADAPYDTFTALSTSTGSTLFAVRPTANGIAWVGGLGGTLGYVDLRP